MSSIDGRIRLIKGSYLGSRISLNLEFDDNNERLVRVNGQQFNSKTDLRLSYDKEGKISNVKGKKRRERVNIKVGHVGNGFSTFMNLRTGKFFDVLYNQKGELEVIRGISERIDTRFIYEGDRLVERNNFVIREALDLTYEKAFPEKPTVYRTNQNKELSLDVEVDTQTIINYFLFLN